MLFRSSEKSQSLRAYAEAENLSKELSINKNINELELKIIIAAHDRRSLRGGWICTKGELLIGNHKIIAISKRTFILDYPTSRRDHSRKYFGIDADYRVLEISTNKDRAEFSIFDK